MKIKLPKEIKIGGFIYTVKWDSETQRILNNLNYKGACDNAHRTIELLVKQSPEDFNNTCLHEFVEAVNNIWCGDKIEHEDITNLINGLHQIFEQLEIHFKV